MLAVNRQQTYLSIEDYLKQEEAAEFKSEYYGGEAIPMAGASINHNHNRIALNLYSSLLNLAFRGTTLLVFL